LIKLKEELFKYPLNYLESLKQITEIIKRNKTDAWFIEEELNNIICDIINNINE
jgi:hypothetical protein